MLGTSSLLSSTPVQLTPVMKQQRRKEQAEILGSIIQECSHSCFPLHQQSPDPLLVDEGSLASIAALTSMSCSSLPPFRSDEIRSELQDVNVVHIPILQGSPIASSSSSLPLNYSLSSSSSPRRRRRKPRETALSVLSSRLSSTLCCGTCRTRRRPRDSDDTSAATAPTTLAARSTTSTLDDGDHGAGLIHTEVMRRRRRTATTTACPGCFHHRARHSVSTQVMLLLVQYAMVVSLCTVLPPASGSKPARPRLVHPAHQKGSSPFRKKSPPTQPSFTTTLEESNHWFSSSGPSWAWSAVRGGDEELTPVEQEQKRVLARVAQAQSNEEIDAYIDQLLEVLEDPPPNDRHTTRADQQKEPDEKEEEEEDEAAVQGVSQDNRRANENAARSPPELSSTPPLTPLESEPKDDLVPTTVTSATKASTKEPTTTRKSTPKKKKAKKKAQHLASMSSENLHQISQHKRKIKIHLNDTRPNAGRESGTTPREEVTGFKTASAASALPDGMLGVAEMGSALSTPATDPPSSSTALVSTAVHGPATENVTTVNTKSTDQPLPRPPLRRPLSPLFRFLLNRGRVGQVVALYLILVTELIHTYLPTLDVFVQLAHDRVWPPASLQGETSRRLSQNRTVPTTAATKTLSQYSRTGSSSRQQKELTKQIDAMAWQQLKQAGNIRQVKYRYVSVDFMKRHGLGPFASTVSGDTLTRMADESASLPVPNLERNRLTTTALTESRMVASSAVKQTPVPKHHDDTEWIIRALTKKRNGSNATGGKSLSIQPTIEVELGSTASVGFELPIGGSSNDRDCERRRAAIETAVTQARKARTATGPRASDRSGGDGLVGRLRAGVNSHMSRSLFGAYPGDAVPLTEAGSSDGLADLASKYGWGDWDDNHELVGGKRVGTLGSRYRASKRKFAEVSTGGESSISRFGIEFEFGGDSSPQRDRARSARNFPVTSRPAMSKRPDANDALDGTRSKFMMQEPVNSKSVTNVRIANRDQPHDEHSGTKRHLNVIRRQEDDLVKPALNTIGERARRGMGRTRENSKED